MDEPQENDGEYTEREKALIREIKQVRIRYENQIDRITLEHIKRLQAIARWQRVAYWVIWLIAAGLVIGPFIWHYLWR